MPWPMGELFGDIRDRLQASVVWNTVTRQNYPISAAFAFFHFCNIARSRHLAANLPFVRWPAGYRLHAGHQSEDRLQNHPAMRDERHEEAQHAAQDRG